MNLVIGTYNFGKIKEIENLLQNLDINFFSLKDVNVNKKIDENGNSYKENAIKKALEICKLCNKTVLAEDSGLEVDFLNGEPGIYSARLASDDEKRNNKILEFLKKVPFEKRKARFVSVVALAQPNKKVITRTGICKGFIATEIQGTHGFGFDPIFIIPKYNKSFGELGSEIKNKISHRAQSLMKIKIVLEKILIGA
ncbi:MAG: RdgB/HAM1 family non-canonical purine NTP pyrophosphatase [bacterium]